MRIEFVPTDRSSRYGHEPGSEADSNMQDIAVGVGNGLDTLGDGNAVAMSFNGDDIGPAIPTLGF